MADDWNIDDEEKTDWSGWETTTGPADGADGWVEPPVEEAPDAPLAPTDDLWTTKKENPRAAQGVPLPRQPGAPRPKPKPEPLSDIDSGKAMAIFAHCSIVLGLPIFIVPLLQRDNPFALQHAKAAAVNFGFFLLFFVMAFLTCGLSVPLIFLCYIPALVGIVNAANGERASTWALGGMGESIFGGVHPKPESPVATTPPELEE